MNVSKIQPLGATGQVQKAKSSAVLSASSTFASMPNYADVAASKMANSLQAMNAVSFGSAPFVKPYKINENEIVIPDLLYGKGHVHLKAGIPSDKRGADLNAKGLHVHRNIESDGSRYVRATDDKGATIFEARIGRGVATPKFVYRQGKYDPEVGIIDSTLGKAEVKMLAGSEFIGRGFKCVMPGKYVSVNEKEHQISFTGNPVVSTLKNEPRTQNAIELYQQSGLASEAIKGDFYDVVKENDPTLVIPAGGFGERFFNLTRGFENKPAFTLPTRDGYRIMATTLNMGVAGGYMDGTPGEKITYLSQGHDLEAGQEGVHHVRSYKTDGGAIADAIHDNIINKDKDAVILNADIFTNADTTRAYNALKTLPNAAIVIPYFPVPESRTKDFGLIGVEENGEGDLQIKKFVEKPKSVTVEPKKSDFADEKEYKKQLTAFQDSPYAKNPKGDGTYLANPGMYFLSKEALEVLDAMGVAGDDITGLGANVVPRIVELCNRGRLVDKNGNKMVAYTVPLEAKDGKPAFWDDIGSAKAYVNTVRDVAGQTRRYGTTEENKYYGIPNFVLEDFMKNTDLKRGIVFNSEVERDAFKNLEEKYSATARGNIYVAAPVPSAV